MTIKHPLFAASKEDIRALYRYRKGEPTEVAEQQAQAWVLIEKLRDSLPDRFKVAQTYLRDNSRPTVALAMALHTTRITQSWLEYGINPEPSNSELDTF